MKYLQKSLIYQEYTEFMTEYNTKSASDDGLYYDDTERETPGSGWSEIRVFQQKLLLWQDAERRPYAEGDVQGRFH
jgi:hypothetical protein